MDTLIGLVEQNIITLDQHEVLDDILDAHDLYSSTDLRDEFDQVLNGYLYASEVYGSLLSIAYTTTKKLALSMGIVFKEDAMLSSMSNILRTIKTVLSLDPVLKRDIFDNIVDINKLEIFEFILEDYSVNSIGLITDTIEEVEDSFMDTLYLLLKAEDIEASDDLDMVIEIRNTLKTLDVTPDILSRVLDDLMAYNDIYSIPEFEYNKYINSTFETASVFTVVALTLFNKGNNNYYFDIIRPKLNIKHVRALDSIYGVNNV